MSARRLMVCAALLASLTLAAPAQAGMGGRFHFGPDTSVTPNQEVTIGNFGSAPYDAFVATPMPYSGPDALIDRFLVWLTPPSNQAQASGLGIFQDAGTTINMVNFIPTGPLMPNTLNTIQLPNPVMLRMGESIGVAIDAPGSGGPVGVGGYGSSATSFIIANYPGTTGSFSKSGEATGLTIAAAVEGPFDETPEEKLFRCTLGREPVNKVTADCQAPLGSRVFFTGEIRFPEKFVFRSPDRADAKQATFKLKPKTVEFKAEEQTVRLKWKKNAKTVKQLEEVLEENAKAAKKKLVVDAAVTYPDGSTETEREKAKLKP